MSDLLTQGQEAARIEKVVSGLEEADAVTEAPVLPEADQAPVLEAPAELTAQDTEGIAKLSDHVVDLSGKAPEAAGSLDQASPEVRAVAVNKTDASARLNDVYAQEAAVATEEIAKTIPGSPEEKAALAEMKARIAPQVEAIQEEKLTATPDVPEKPKAKKKSKLNPLNWFK